MLRSSLLSDCAYPLETLARLRCCCESRVARFRLWPPAVDLRYVTVVRVVTLQNPKSSIFAVRIFEGREARLLCADRIRCLARGMMSRSRRTRRMSSSRGAISSYKSQVRGEEPLALFAASSMNPAYLRSAGLNAVAKSLEEVVALMSNTSIFVAAIEGLLGHRLQGALQSTAARA